MIAIMIVIIVCHMMTILDFKPPLSQPWSQGRDPGLEKPWIPGTDLGPDQIPQIYSNRLNFFAVTPSLIPLWHARCFPGLFEDFFRR